MTCGFSTAFGDAGMTHELYFFASLRLICEGGAEAERSELYAVRTKMGGHDGRPFLVP
jgi:hypothetical protein